MITKDRLYGEKLTTVETYEYDISHLGISELSLCNLEKISIKFVNGKFSRCDFPFSGIYTEEQWEVLEAISLKIREISAKKKEKK